MKATFKFDLKDPDEKIDYNIFNQADRYYLSLHDLYSFLRNKWKYGQFKTKEAKKLIDEIYSEFFDILKENDADIEMG